MAANTNTPPRRRSSIAYDPARDIFKTTAPSVEESGPTPVIQRDDPESSSAMTSSPAADKSASLPRGSAAVNGTHELSKPISREEGLGSSPSVQEQQSLGRKRRLSDSIDDERKEKIVRQDKPTNSPRGSEGRDKETSSNGTREKEPMKPKTVADLPRIKRKERDDGSRQVQRSRDTASVYGRRDIDRTRSPTRRRQGDRDGPVSRRSFSPRSRSPPGRRSPGYRRRDPSPRRSRSPSPLRPSPPPENRPARKRPGCGARINASQIEAARRLQSERERGNQQIVSSRGVQDMSNQFYNARPEYVKQFGREWRKTESKIKGLRSFNNWIKSAIIQKFSPDEPVVQEERGWGQEEPEALAPEEKKPLLVLDIGCGKGGDLGKWQQAPQTVGLYVGLDPADTSIGQAHDRYIGMRRGRRPLYDGRFVTKDCFGEWIGDIPIIQEVGIDGSVGPGGNMMNARWGRSGGFDVVTMMFSMHYAFENEQKARMMLRNVAGALKKGGRFIGVVPNSDILSARVVEWHQKRKEQGVKAANGEAEDQEPAEEGEVEDEDEAAPSPRWGNSLYKVKFTGVTPPDGIFRPATGWKYTYWMEEAVDVPEYVVPWEAFRALAEDYNLEQRYRKPFLDIWENDKDDSILGPLSVRMGVRKYESGPLEMNDEEREAVSFYHAFCFTKV